MGRLDKMKRQAMLEANKTLLKEEHPTMSDFCSELTALCEKHGMTCDCDEVINITKPLSIEDNPFSI